MNVCPFHKFELTNQLRSQPSALRHLRSRECRSPAACLFGQVGEGVLGPALKAWQDLRLQQFAPFDERLTRCGQHQEIEQRQDLAVNYRVVWSVTRAFTMAGYRPLKSLSLRDLR